MQFAVGARAPCAEEEILCLRDGSLKALRPANLQSPVAKLPANASPAKVLIYLALKAFLICLPTVFLTFFENTAKGRFDNVVHLVPLAIVQVFADLSVNVRERRPV